jgi:Xaa-Pro aminopeptidase
MASKGVHGYIVPTADAHNSEYVRNCDKRRAFISGFTGSAGTAVITDTDARLWTDGRYFLQALEELGPDWTLMKDRLNDTPTVEGWLAKELKSDMRVGYDPSVVSVSLEQSWRQVLEPAGVNLAPLEANLIDEVWDDRPAPPSAPFIHLKPEFTGALASEKIASLRQDMAEKSKTNISIVTALDDVNWMLNIRGKDIDYNPVAIAFLIVTMDTAIICSNVEQVRGGDVAAHFEKEGVVVRPYEELTAVLKEQAQQLKNDGGAKFWVDKRSCNSAVFAIAKQLGTVVVDPPFPVALNKSIKNETEIRGMTRAHVRDGAALVSYLAWLEENMENGPVSAEGTVEGMDEVSVADELERLRSKKEFYQGLSFETISSSGPNGAVIHYAPERGKCRRLNKAEMYLCDSGAQYMDGTTDVTRTVHFGTPSEHEKRCFTRVLQGHIALATAVFPVGTPGHKLDILARLPLYRDGLDYRHGTGHGVGAFLNVHEGPHGIGTSFRTHYKGGFQAGMTTSNEPGYYEDGNFGIRIENVLVAEPCETIHNFGDVKYLRFRNLTMAPLQQKLINLELLSPYEVAWVDTYHKDVRDALLPLLESDGDERAKKFLLRETEPLA